MLEAKQKLSSRLNDALRTFVALEMSELVKLFFFFFFGLETHKNKRENKKQKKKKKKSLLFSISIFS